MLFRSPIPSSFVDWNVLLSLLTALLSWYPVTMASLTSWVHQGNPGFNYITSHNCLYVVKWWERLWQAKGPHIWWKPTASRWGTDILYRQSLSSIEIKEVWKGREKEKYREEEEKEVSMCHHCPAVLVTFLPLWQNIMTKEIYKKKKAISSSHFLLRSSLLLNSKRVFLQSRHKPFLCWICGLQIFLPSLRTIFSSFIKVFHRAKFSALLWFIPSPPFIKCFGVNLSLFHKTLLCYVYV